ncbi:MAG: glycoside hydrolase family 3 C-terminal domain-containing protein [Candidatus Lokiarchaeota archaeon]|nr:glycoside hydrolase family 3 C-terminal domain-containing protein [Candidatus Lokiarchaeota archaeon]
MNDDQIEKYVNDIISKLSLKEKVYVLSGHQFFKIIIKDRAVGKHPYSGGGVKRFNIPPFLFTDGSRGVIMPNSTCFPVSMARAATWDVHLEEEVGNIIGKECRDHGANLFGGVCINLLRHPAWGRAQETYGEDSFLLGEMGASLIRGVQKHNVMGTVKHFALNNIEFSRHRVNILIEERTLREVYLPHFKRCIDQGCATVMTAYNKVRGEYCGQNYYLLRKILKEEWKFKGFIHSDWMHGLYDGVKGITAGLDVEMPRAKYYGNNLIKKVKKGLVALDLINDSVRRIIYTVLKFINMKDPENYDKKIIGSSKHIELSRKVAENSMVLLKNDRKILPLDLKKIKKIAVLGKLSNIKNTGDHGSSNVKQKNIITPLQGIKNYVGDSVEIIYRKKIKPAIKIAKEVDVNIIVVGYTYKDEGEYIKQKLRKVGDRLDLGLKPKEVLLIKTISKINPNCIVILVGGSAILMEEWRHTVPAILMVWYSGMEGGNALANIIFGSVNPSGKLPLTIPRRICDLPFFDSKADEIEYGYYHGYCKFDKERLDPAFYFGFGLSYTEYEYKNLNVELNKDKIILSVDVKNIGKRSGEEIVQMYVGFENSEVDRPLKLLRGFKKIRLGSDEVKKVQMDLMKKDLAWYNPKSKSWEIEKMEYSIYVGSSSKFEDLLKKKIIIS